MGVSKYTTLYYGLYVSDKTLETLKEEVETTYIQEPATKFNPDTGERNESIQKTRTDKAWPAPLADLFSEDNQDDLSDYGVDFLGFTAVRPWEVEGIFIYDTAMSVGNDYGATIKFMSIDDNIKAKFKEVFEPFNLWKEDNFGVWTHSYWS